MKFEFYRDLSCKEIEVIKNIQETGTLFNFFSKNLQFPWYFGENWDALIDCFYDLSWISEIIIIIKHLDIPFSNKPKEQENYLDVLNLTIKHWEKYPEHKVHVLFPERYKEELNNLLLKYKLN